VANFSFIRGVANHSKGRSMTYSKQGPMSANIYCFILARISPALLYY